ncbi:protein ILRUN [Lates japonicus]|uniref:Protein ILRUN n=1 Tax=Lates japonicus TaxID=270547 RepID=A0AAD3MP69_LATJO|nr:protein ILRUN [Lates japonicus]
MGKIDNWYFLVVRPTFVHTLLVFTDVICDFSRSWRSLMRPSSCPLETEFNTQPQRTAGDFSTLRRCMKNKHDATDNSFRDPGGS